MVKTRKQTTRKTRNGGGYLSDQQMFNPDVLPPATSLAGTSTAPTADMIRPVLLSTFSSPLLQAGGTRKRIRGGFSPSIMGPFLANAQAAIVPLAGYLVYQTMIPKTGSSVKTGGKKHKKSRRNRA